MNNGSHPYVTQEKYHEWIEELQKVLADSPFEKEWAERLALICCFATNGLCFCPCVYYKVKIFFSCVTQLFE